MMETHDAYLAEMGGSYESSIMMEPPGPERDPAKAAALRIFNRTVDALAEMAEQLLSERDYAQELSETVESLLEQLRIERMRRYECMVDWHAVAGEEKK